MNSGEKYVLEMDEAQWSEAVAQLIALKNGVHEPLRSMAGSILALVRDGVRVREPQALRPWADHEGWGWRRRDMIGTSRAEVWPGLSPATHWWWSCSGGGLPGGGEGYGQATSREEAMAAADRCAIALGWTLRGQGREEP